METETGNVPVTMGEIWEKLTTEEKHFVSTRVGDNRGVIGLMTVDSTLAKITSPDDMNRHCLCLTCVIVRKLRGLVQTHKRINKE